jgi:hypothetical protein
VTLTPQATQYLTVMIILPHQNRLSPSHTCTLVIHTNKREQLKQTDHSTLYSCHSSNSLCASGRTCLKFKRQSFVFYIQHRFRNLETCLLAIKMWISRHISANKITKWHALDIAEYFNNIVDISYYNFASTTQSISVRHKRNNFSIKSIQSTFLIQESHVIYKRHPIKKGNILRNKNQSVNDVLSHGNGKRTISF